MDTQRIDVSEGAVEWLNKQNWHDSVLHEIRFVRSGSADQVVLLLDLLQDWNEYISRRCEIVFNDCRRVRSDMHWGVVCMSDGEMIYAALAEMESDLVAAVREEWSQLLTNKVVAQFTLDLGSTGSQLALVIESITWRFLGDQEPHPASPPYPLKPAG